MVATNHFFTMVHRRKYIYIYIYLFLQSITKFWYLSLELTIEELKAEFVQVIIKSIEFINV